VRKARQIAASKRCRNASFLLDRSGLVAFVAGIGFANARSRADHPGQEISARSRWLARAMWIKPAGRSYHRGRTDLEPMEGPSSRMVHRAGTFDGALTGYFLIT